MTTPKQERSMSAPDPYLQAIRAQRIGAATTDGFSELRRVEADSWQYIEPREDAPGYDECVLDDVQAADVLRNVFPGSFGSPEAS